MMENKKCLKPPTRLPEGYLSNLPLFTVPPASRAPDVAVDVFTDARKEGVPGVRAVNVPGKNRGHGASGKAWPRGAMMLKFDKRRHRSVDVRVGGGWIISIYTYIYIYMFRKCIYIVIVHNIAIVWRNTFARIWYINT